MKISFIIQARLGSSRLPGKILLPFYNQKTMLDLLIEKLSTIDDVDIVIATSLSKENDRIEKVAQEHGAVCFRGSETDVLQRFIDAAHSVGTEHIIRICSDNPFLELASINRLIDFVRHSDTSLDYVSFDIYGCPSIKTHYGFWAEYVSLSALEKVSLQTSDLIYHEHVTNYIYTHPDIFNIKWLSCSTDLTKHENIRLTIDTEDDFKNSQSIYKELCQFNPNPNINEIILFLDSHLEYYKLMETQIINNLK